jgi:DNA-binding protein H-NS
MRSINLRNLSLEGLTALRGDVDKVLAAHRREIERKLALIEAQGIDGAPVRRAPPHGLKGRKVTPKYRSRKNRSLVWSGRGMIPRWMKEEMMGTKLRKDAFLIK